MSTAYISSDESDDNKEYFSSVPNSTATSAISASTNSSPQQYLVPKLPVVTSFNGSKSPIINRSPINAKFSPSDVSVNKVAPAQLRQFLEENEVVVIDVRCFNQFSNFKLKDSLNICIPSTLLRRASYRLPNILSSFQISDSVRSVLLDGPTTKILFVDANSDDYLSHSLHHTIQKFQSYNPNFQIWYLEHGVDALDKNSELIEFESPVSSPTQAHSDPPSVLSSFYLPSSTPANQKFLNSLKKNVPRLDMKAINEDLQTYHHNFKLPQKIDKLPLWLKGIVALGSNDQILKTLNVKFNKIEKVEQIRLNLAISSNATNIDVGESHSNFCSPSTPCPNCDDINYKLPKGIEYGFKNRYNNVWPYEHSRVKLVNSPCNNCVPSNVDDDYFNGNYIKFSKISNKCYIATQNPLPSTYNDFWKLIWDMEVNLIVCLNAQDQVRYFNNQKLEGFEVNQKVVQNHGDFNLRHIELTNTKKQITKTTYHLEFLDWPDFGVPKVESLLKFIDFKQKLIKEKNLGDMSLVHCSAGCGRTGCFIATDLIIDLFNNPTRDEDMFDPYGDVDLIYKSVQFQRSQRISMCQNFDQFLVCYESILEYLTN